ncbi:3-Oxoacyl-(acyl-carrier-protein (ACP)) synthase III domain protein [Methylobacterium sp. 4-46]|uniref:beta-ketoacyl-ACP synthase III n=1 Tax=unclassified Methylobacterium TaxID=2615210 RepID=UPI000152CF41|nr:MULTISPECIES: beta-ketoacyl-ACP synthase III [Methylobacterium]ACA14753.1 3-Oxoacyl-(acyl-carrier-protein (ACP)) synthase III domain protein [Methylobacterium sp. 4-46]WFT80505.1 beta-ketoacyl-ACP synthase III [Methylobacterium nodulans]
MHHAYITNTSLFLPNRPVGNDEMEAVLGIAGSKPSALRPLILEKNGIKARHYAIDPETGRATHTNAEMTAAAVRGLFAGEPEGLESLDFLACGTSSPDQVRPSHAVMVHGLLRSPPCEVASFEGMCVVGAQSLKSAQLMVATGEAESAVATGSEAASSFMRGSFFTPEFRERQIQLEKNPILAFEKDFLRWMLSDGAGAVLVRSKPDPARVSLRIEWVDVVSYAGEHDVCMYHGAVKDEDGRLVGYRNLPPETWHKASVFAFKQDVELLNEHMLALGARAYRTVKDRRRLDEDKVTYFLPHISSYFFKEQMLKHMGEYGLNIPESKWFMNLERVGNVGSASPYAMLDELFKSGRLRPGDQVLLFVPESGRFTMSYILLTAV